MERHKHVITCTTGDKVPSRWCLMAVNLKSGEIAGHYKSGILTVDVGSAVLVRTSGSNIIRQTYKPLNSRDAVRDLLLSLCPSNSRCELICRDALTVMTAIGLWDLIAAGELQIVGNDPTGGANPGKGKKRQWRGLCVLEPSPFICQLRSPRTGSILTITDPENYSACKLNGSDEPELVCGDMLNWLVEWLLTIKRLRLGTWQRTIASQAYYGWRRTYLQAAVEVHDSEFALCLERLAYFGGRCEPKHLGYVRSWDATGPTVGFYGDEVPTKMVQGGIYRLDVNSSYAAAGAFNTVPVQLKTVGHECDPDGVLGYMNGVGVIACVTVQTTAPVVPYSPERDGLIERLLKGEGIDWEARPKLDRIIYPVGTFRTVLCGPELQELCKVGKVLKVHAWATYRLDWAFAKWGNAIWEERRDAEWSGHHAIKNAMKLLPVVIFGRMGRQRKQWRDATKEPTLEPYAAWYRRDAESGKLLRWRSVGYRVQVLADGGETADSCPMVPAWINSLARVRLWSLMQTAGQHNVYYYDTDSIWTNGEGLSSLDTMKEVDALALGKLKVEAEYKWCEFIGPKHYRTPSGLVCASMPGSARTDNGTDYWWADIEGMPVALTHRRPPEPIERVRTWRVPAALPLGLRQQNGTILPFTLGGEEDRMKG